MKKKKIDILMLENGNLRAEITVLIKNIQSFFFSFIGSLGLFVGILSSLDRKTPDFDFNAGILAFLISQVGIIIIFIAINIQVDVFTKAAYISHLEKKINALVGEQIIFWESKIASYSRHKKAFLISQLSILFSYFLSFIFLTIYSFNKMNNWWLLLVQIVEALILIYLIYQTSQVFSNTNKYINSIETEIKEN